MGGDSADNAEISGSLSDRIATTLIYGEEKKSDADSEIGKIKKALTDFANQVKMKKNWK